MTARETIDEFLGCKRIAVAGVSRNPKDFTRSLFGEFRRRGYDVVPVTPHAGEVDGIACFARMQDISPPVDGALLLTSPSVTNQVVHDCADAGIRRIWMFRGGGKGAVSDSALEFCESRNMHVVGGECPFMFFPHTSLVHRIHGWFHRV